MEIKRIYARGWLEVALMVARQVRIHANMFEIVEKHVLYFSRRCFKEENFLASFRVDFWRYMQQVWSLADILKIKPFWFLRVWGPKKLNLKNLDEYANMPTVFKSFENIFFHFSRPYYMGENCCSNYQGFGLSICCSIQDKKDNLFIDQLKRGGEPHFSPL